MSSGFKVKKITLYDSFNEEIRVETKPLICINESKENLDFCKDKKKSAIVFQTNSLRQNKKSVKIPAYGDYQATVYIGNKSYSIHTIRGVEELMKLPKYNKSEKIKAKISLELTDFGLPFFSEAFASVPMLYNKSVSVEINDSEPENINQNRNETNQNSSISNHTSKKAKTLIYETRTIEITEYETKDLNFSTEFLISPKPMTADEIAISKTKLQKLVLKENELVQLSEAKNKVESLVYSIKDWLSTSGNIEFMINEEYLNLTSMVEYAQDKLDNQNQLLDVNTSRNISKKLSDYFNVIKKRRVDYYNFNDTIYSAYQLINKTQKEIENLITDKPWINAVNLKSIYEEIIKFNFTIIEAKNSFPNYNKSSDTLFNMERVNNQKSTFHALFEMLRYIEKPRPPKKNQTKPEVNATKEKNKTFGEDEIIIEDDSENKEKEKFEEGKKKAESKETNQNQSKSSNSSTNSQNSNTSEGNNSKNIEKDISSSNEEL